MWSNNFSFGLRIERHWCLPAGIVGLTLAALLAVWLSRLSAVCALPLATLACLQGWRALRTGGGVSDILVDAAGRIWQEARTDAELQLTGRPWIVPGVATGFRLADRDGLTSSIILFRWQLCADTWRRLLVRLRRN